MVVDIEKIRKDTCVRIKFPSKTKARKFIKQLKANGFTTAYEDDLNNFSTEQELLIYKDTLLVTKSVEERPCAHYTEYLLKGIKETPAVPTRRATVHYFTADIHNSDLALRYYVEFVDRPDYVGRWFIKDKKKKQYLGVTEEQAYFVLRTMTENSMTRVLGFPVQKGFQRTHWDSSGNLINTELNNGK